MCSLATHSHLFTGSTPSNQTLRQSASAETSSTPHLACSHQSTCLTSACRALANARLAFQADPSPRAAAGSLASRTQHSPYRSRAMGGLWDFGSQGTVCTAGTRSPRYGTSQVGLVTVNCMFSSKRPAFESRPACLFPATHTDRQACQVRCWASGLKSHAFCSEAQR